MFAHRRSSGKSGGSRGAGGIGQRTGLRGPFVGRREQVQAGQMGRDRRRSGGQRRGCGRVRPGDRIAPVGNCTGQLGDVGRGAGQPEHGIQRLADALADGNPIARRQRVEG